MPKGDWNRRLLPEARVRELVSKGASQQAMSREFGVTPKVIRRICRELGLVPKPGYKGQPMEKNYFWRGGRTLDGKHILVKVPGHPQANRHGYVREHRLVMEKELGRQLYQGEVVHHIDGNPQNNELANLMVFSTNADHLRYELTGRLPEWTRAGRRRISEGVRQGVKTRRAAMLDRILDLLSGLDVQVSRRTMSQYRRLAKDPRFLLEILERNEARPLSERLPRDREIRWDALRLPFR